MNQQKEWQTLSLANPSTLNETIRELHHAAQFIAMAGHSLLPGAEDDSNTNMGWSDEIGGLAGRVLPLNVPCRLALVYDSFELRFVDKHYKTLRTLKLAGQTKRTVRNWMLEGLTDFGGRTDALQPVTHYEIPEHATDRGGSFRLTSTYDLRELARYRHNTKLILEELAVHFDNASSVRIWPHHFDTGMVIPAAINKEDQTIKSVGIGLATPDENYNELYFYINHWVAAGGVTYAKLPELPSEGRWHRDGWVGAILLAADVVAHSEGSAQYEAVWRFFRAGINETLRLIGQGEMTF